MAGKKWSDSSIGQATSIAATDQFLIIQASTGLSKRITQQVMQSSSGSNLKTVEYTIGAPGVADCDYNFTSVANANEQSIQLGAAAIIPTYSTVVLVTVSCVAGVNGAITGDVQVGNASGSDEYLAGQGAAVDDTGDFIGRPFQGNNTLGNTAASVYFSFTPSANWNTITTGKWKIWISYIDNSIL